MGNFTKKEQPLNLKIIMQNVLKILYNFFENNPPANNQTKAGTVKTQTKTETVKTEKVKDTEAGGTDDNK